MRKKNRSIASFAIAVAMAATAVTAVPASAEDAVTLTSGVAAQVLDLASNVTTSKSITTDSSGTTKTVASATNNTSIYYLGDFTPEEIKNIEIRAALVDRGTSGTSQINIAYMDVTEGDDITSSDSTYISTNSSTIRSANNKLGVIAGTTTVSDELMSGNKTAVDYIGAVWTIDSTGVTVDSDTYSSSYPNGTATLDTTNSKALTTTATETKHIFIYTTAQNGRITMDYVKLTLPSGDVKIDLSGNTVYKYTVPSRTDNYSHTDGGTVTSVNATRTVITGSKLIDNDTSTTENLSNANSVTTSEVIDLGTSAPTITKLVFTNVSSSAIFGFADDNSTSEVGYITDSTITLKTNWARLNNSKTKNLNDDITVTYGTLSSGKYDTVTVEGNMTGRYLVFDGNGSTTYCDEIEVYISGDDTYEYTTPIMASYATSYDTITPATLKANNSLTLVTDGGTAVDNLPETMSVTTYTIRIENYDATYGTPVLTVDGENLQATVDSNLQNYYLATDGTTAYFTYQVYGATDYATAVTWNGEAGIVKNVA